MKVGGRRDVAKRRRRDQPVDSSAVEPAPYSHVGSLDAHAAERQRTNRTDRQIDAFSGEPKAYVLAADDYEAPPQVRREDVDARPKVHEHRHRRRSVYRTL